jgi:hypothetical protein
MKLSQTELVLVGLIIVYVAFFSHPPPSHIKDFLSSPVGHVVVLLGVLYVTVYRSLVVGLFLGIAYLMTAAPTTEYLDPEAAPPVKPTPAKPHIGPPPAPTGLADMMKEMKGKMEKGDTVAHKAVAGKSVTAPPPPPRVAPKAAPPSKGTAFSSV